MNEKLYNGLLNGLVIFLERNLSQIHKNWWDELVVPFLNNYEYTSAEEYDLKTLDLKALVNVFRGNYKEFYERKKFTNWSPFYLSGVIKTIRNEKAHSNLKKIRTSEEIILDIISSKIFLSNLDEINFEKNLELQAILNSEMTKQFKRYNIANEVEENNEIESKNENINNIDNFNKLFDNLNDKIDHKLNSLNLNIEKSSDNISNVNQMDKVEKLLLDMQNKIDDNYNKIKILLDNDNNKIKQNNKNIENEELEITKKIDEDSIMDIVERNVSNLQRTINYNTAKDLLLGLREIIKEENPDIKDEYNVLRSTMINNFLSNKITNNDLYFEKISPEMHNLTNRKSLQYLPEIYSIVKKLK